VLAVIAAEPELFTGSFTEGIVRYAAARPSTRHVSE
jgi:hypothetical protein